MLSPVAEIVLMLAVLALVPLVYYLSLAATRDSTTSPGPGLSFRRRRRRRVRLLDLVKAFA